MVFTLSHIAWWVVALAGILAIAIGMLWYSPMLFGERWMKLTKVKLDKNMSVMDLFGGFLVGFLQAYGLAYCLEKFDALGMVCAIKAALFLGVLFVATQHLSAVIWSKKPLELFYIEVGCTLVTWAAIAALFAYMA